MTPPPEQPRNGMRKVVVVIPSAFTLGSLYFGVWAIVSAAAGNFLWAGWFVVFAGILDMFDGRVARISRTSTRFGAELDSLSDLISFGVAPAMIMYFLVFSTGERFSWLICYIYIVAAATRLARYNVMAEESGPSPWFTGIPSTAAGMTLATWYPFTQTDWYQRFLPDLNIQHALTILMIVLAVLMVSNVKFPKFPSGGFRNARQIGGSAVWLLLLAGGLTIPEKVLFPLGIFYLLFGMGRAFLTIIAERPDGPGNGPPLRNFVRSTSRRDQRSPENPE